jgi:hypothetical protein
MAQIIRKVLGASKKGEEFQLCRKLHSVHVKKRKKGDDEAEHGSKIQRSIRFSIKK